MSRRLPLLIITVAGLVLTGCVSSEPKVTEEEQVSAEQLAQMRATEPAAEGEEATGGETLTFVARDIEYAEAPSEAPAGLLTIELVNEGAINHDVVIEELGNQLIVEAVGGATETGQVELEAGTYTYYCDVPGHRAAGMEGTLTVTG